MKKGYIHVYTGNGKGKTTCAIGLAVRALGAGMHVYLGQFLKAGNYSEIKALENFSPQITIRQYGSGNGFITKTQINEEEKASARAGLLAARAALFSGGYDMVILDEIHIALYFGLIREEEVLEIMEKKPVHTELILTGRKAAKSIMDKADLVTQMRQVRHYMEAGVTARAGIEQ